jgi:hypothetical protein
MRKLILNEFMSLDGVAQSPGYPDEDPSGGFKHGGWHMQYMDENSGKWVTDLISSAGGLVLGRRTYDIFAAYWPNAPEGEAVIARPLSHAKGVALGRWPAARLGELDTGRRCPGSSATPEEGAPRPHDDRQHRTGQNTGREPSD